MGGRWGSIVSGCGKGGILWVREEGAWRALFRSVNSMSGLGYKRLYALLRWDRGRRAFLMCITV